MEPLDGTADLHSRRACRSIVGPVVAPADALRKLAATLSHPLHRRLKVESMSPKQTLVHNPVEKPPVFQNRPCLTPSRLGVPCCRLAGLAAACLTWRSCAIEVVRSPSAAEVVQRGELALRIKSRS